MRWDKFSSNVNEVIRAVLNFIFFWTKIFCTHQKHQKHKDATKQKHKNANKRISDFFLLRCFYGHFLLLFAVSLLSFFVLVKSSRKKNKKFKTALITSFTLLLPSSKNGQEWPKDMAFGLFKKLTSLVLSGICVKSKFLWFINILRKLHAWEKSSSQVKDKNGSQPMRFQYSFVISISLID